MPGCNTFVVVARQRDHRGPQIIYILVISLGSTPKTRWQYYFWRYFILLMHESDRTRWNEDGTFLPLNDFHNPRRSYKSCKKRKYISSPFQFSIQWSTGKICLWYNSDNTLMNITSVPLTRFVIYSTKELHSCYWEHCFKKIHDIRRHCGIGGMGRSWLHLEQCS